MQRTHTRTHGDTYRKRHDDTQYVLEILVLLCRCQVNGELSQATVFSSGCTILTQSNWHRLNSLATVLYARYPISTRDAQYSWAWFVFAFCISFVPLYTSHHWDFLYCIEGYFKALTAAIQLILEWARSCRCCCFFRFVHQLMNSDLAEISDLTLNKNKWK